jgi:hypothetical protein
LNKQIIGLGACYLKLQKMLSSYKEKVAFIFTFMIGVICIAGGFKYGTGSLPNLDRGAYPVFVGLIISVLSIFLFLPLRWKKLKRKAKPV